MQETQVPSLGQEDPLEKGMATHSCILAWRIPMDKGAWWATDTTLPLNHHYHHQTLLSEIGQAEKHNCVISLIYGI